MNDDDLKELARLILAMDSTPMKSDPNYREPGMGTDWDCRIGEFLIKKRMNPYVPDPCGHESMSYIGSVGKDQWKCFRCGYVTPVQNTGCGNYFPPSKPNNSTACSSP